MSILHRYLLKDLLYYFGVLLGAVTTLFLANEMFETRDEILDRRPAAADVIEYVALSIPGQVVEVLPMIGMFASLIAIGLLAKNRELLAMVATGVSFRVLARPVAVFGLLVMGLSFWLAEYVAPAARSRSDWLYRIRIKGGSMFAYTSNDGIFRKGAGGRFYVMKSFDGTERRMIRPTILDVNEDGSGLAQRIEAESARFIAANETDRRQYWEFEKAERWVFEPEGVRVEVFDAPLRVEMEEKLDSFLGREKPPETMDYGELREFCDILELQGDLVQLPRYLTSLHSKLALPFSSLVLAIGGFAVSADPRKRSFVVTVSTGLAIAVGFYLFNEGMLRLGRSGALMPALGLISAPAAAWAPVALFGAIVLERMRGLSMVR